MTHEEITKLAVEYVAKVYGGDTDFIDEAENVISWLLHTHCIVEKSKVKEAEEAVIDGWVARDANGDLELYDGRYILERKNNLGYWTNGFDSVSLPDISFPSVTWESDPLEVTLTIKPKKR